jgi:hypothetical protein
LPQLGQPVNGDAQVVDLPGVAARTAPRCASAASASAASSSPMSLIICASSLLPPVQPAVPTDSPPAR